MGNTSRNFYPFPLGVSIKQYRPNYLPLIYILTSQGVILGITTNRMNRLVDLCKYMDSSTYGAEIRIGERSIFIDLKDFVVVSP